MWRVSSVYIFRKIGLDYVVYLPGLPSMGGGQDLGGNFSDSIGHFTLTDSHLFI